MFESQKYQVWVSETLSLSLRNASLSLRNTQFESQKHQVWVSEHLVWVSEYLVWDVWSEIFYALEESWVLKFSVVIHCVF